MYSNEYCAAPCTRSLGGICKRNRSIQSQSVVAPVTLPYGMQLDKSRKLLLRLLSNVPGCLVRGKQVVLSRYMTDASKKLEPT